MFRQPWPMFCAEAETLELPLLAVHALVFPGAINMFRGKRSFEHLKQLCSWSVSRKTSKNQGSWLVQSSIHSSKIPGSKISKAF